MAVAVTSKQNSVGGAARGRPLSCTVTGTAPPPLQRAHPHVTPQPRPHKWRSDDKGTTRSLRLDRAAQAHGVGVRTDKRNRRTYAGVWVLLRRDCECECAGSRKCAVAGAQRLRRTREGGGGVSG